MTYKKANLDVVEFNTEDVITTSSGAATTPEQPVISDQPIDTPGGEPTED